MEADTAPAKECPDCGRKRLIVMLLMINVPTDPAGVELGLIGARGYLRGDNG
jgi:hypothetical protein